MSFLEIVPRNESHESPAVQNALDSPKDEIEDNFILDAMNRAYDPEINMVRDMRIDDTGLAFAKNYYDYTANVIGVDTPAGLKMPFARQLWLCLKLMNEMCPVCSKRSYFENIQEVPVDADPHDLIKGKYLRLFNHGICPKCGMTRGKAIQEKLCLDYNEAVWVIGQRAGKTTTASMLTTYAFHRMLKSPPLGKVAQGIQGSTQLTASFIALTTTNSYNLLWKPVRDTMVASAWYKDYFDFMDEKKRELGKEFYQFNPTGTYFRSFLKNLDAFPVGPSKRILRGPTRFIAVTDELGHFPFNPNQSEDEEGDDERERANADEVHMVLTNSLATVRAEVINLTKKGIFTYPQGLNLSISSPASWRDKVMRLYTEAQSSLDMLGVRLPTWEVSPMYTRDHPIIVSMYNKNPKKAERDFGANPPKLTSGVFTKEGILPLFKGDMLAAIRYATPTSADNFTSGDAVFLREEATLPPALLALDAGLVNNAFALVVLRPIFNANKTAVSGIEAPVVLEIVPRSGTTIDFVAAYERVIDKLIALNVREVCADRWNSAYILRAIETKSKGAIKAYQYSLKSKDFSQFIDYIPTGQLILPKIEIDPDVAELTIDFKKDLVKYPAAHLYRQFLTVQSYQGMLVKGSDSTDDMFRALVLGVTRFFDEKVMKRFTEYPAIERTSRSNRSVVLVSGRSVGMFNRY